MMPNMGVVYLLKQYPLTIELNVHPKIMYVPFNPHCIVETQSLYHDIIGKLLIG